MAQFHFYPEEYLELMRSEVPAYDEFEDRVAEACRGREVTRILELGTGTGETSRRVLALHPRARLVGIDISSEMIEVARNTLPPEQVEDLRVQDLEDTLPEGPFDLVVSALAIHHLDGAGKADLFRRLSRALAPGARFVMGDVVVPEDRADAITPLTPDYDLPSSLADLTEWLRAAGFEPHTEWTHKDLAIITATLPRSKA